MPHFSWLRTLSAAFRSAPRLARRRSTAVVAGWERLEPRMLLSPLVGGEEFRVNSWTSHSQNTFRGGDAVARDADGDYVVTWTSFTQDGSGNSVHAQLYHANGAPRGGEFLVNTKTDGNQASPAVAMDADGDFVIVWQDGPILGDGSFSGINAQRFNAAGVPQGNEFRVNTTTTDVQFQPTVAMDADGDFVVAWSSSGQDGSSYGVYLQRYNKDGSLAGIETPVNITTASEQRNPSIAMDASGDFVVAWNSFNQDGQGQGIYARRFFVGEGPTLEFRVNSTTTNDQRVPHVAMDATGDFVIAWESRYQDAGTYGIYAQRFNAAGTPQGGEFRVNQQTTGDQFAAAVAMDADGDFVIAWHGDSQDGSGDGVFARRFNAAGAAQSDEFQVNVAWGNEQRNPSVAMDADGEFVVVWESLLQDGSGWGVYGRQYRVNTAPVLNGIPTTQTFTENAAAMLLAPAGTIADADSPDLAGGQLIVQYTAGALATDRLTIRHQGTSAGQVGVNGSNVTFGGTVIGTFTGGVGTAALVVTFNAASSPAAAQAVLRNVLYVNSTDNPTNFGNNPHRNLRFRITDGDGGVSAFRLQTLNVTAVNDVPTIGAFDGAISYTENGTGNLVDSNATIVEPDSSLNGGKLNVRVITNGQSTDRLTIRNQGTGGGQVGVNGTNVTFGGVVIGTLAGGTGTTALVVTFNAAATPTAAQAVLRNVLFSNTSDNPSTAARTVRAQLLAIGGQNGNAATKTINVVARNDAPVVGAFDGAITYTENGAGNIVDSNATISDVDTLVLTGSRLHVSLSANGESTDRLRIRHQGTAAGQVGVSGSNVTFGGTLVGTFTGGNGTAPLVVTFNAAATQGAAQAILRNVLFSSTSEDPSTAARTVRAQMLGVGGQNSVAVTKTINVVAVPG